VQLTVGDRLGQLALGLGHPDQRRLIGPRLEMPVDAVVAGVEPAPGKPLPERRVTAVQSGVPVPVPAQEVGILTKALREVLLPEAFQDRRIVRVGLPDAARRGLDVLLLPPVHRDLGFRYLELFRNGHESPSAPAVIGERRRAGPVRSPRSILKRALPAVKQEPPGRTVGAASRSRLTARPAPTDAPLPEGGASPSPQRWAIAAVMADTVPDGSSTPITSLA